MLVPALGEAGVVVGEILLGTCVFEINVFNRPPISEGEFDWGA